MIRRTSVVVTAAGSAGAATGSGRTPLPVHGRIIAIHLDYSAGAPATTDVTITESANSPALPVLAVANNATDGWYHPVHQADNSLTGADLTNAAVPVFAADHLLVSVAQANDTNTVTVTVIWSED